jgi:hypothetical protein
MHFARQLGNQLGDDPPPKPFLVGSCTAGPPVSLQQKLNRPSVPRNHSRSTRPLAADKAPYLAALVGSSCKMMATALRGGGFQQNRQAGHAHTAVFDFRNKEQASCDAIADSSGPIHRVSTNNE